VKGACLFEKEPQKECLFLERAFLAHIHGIFRAHSIIMENGNEIAEVRHKCSSTTK
jgi:hypothetical protein